jgi:rSAM/selenodomain-associated transferase 1
MTNELDQVSSGDSLLVIMAKAPKPNEVKTRLVPFLTPEEAANFYRSCLLDTLDKVLSLSRTVPALAYTPNGSKTEFLNLCSRDLILFPQSGRDLGERMLNCLRYGFTKGFRYVAVYGADIPHAPTKELLRGFEELRNDRADLAVGPTEDGGYYYIATSSLYPELFRGIEWSTEEVYITTLKRAYTLGLRTAVLASVRDLDRPEDLEAFNEELYLGDFSELDWHSSSRVGKFLAKKLAP